MTLSLWFSLAGRTGWCVGGFLSSAAVEELLDAIAAVEQTGRQRAAGEGRRDLVDEVNYNKVFLQRLNLWKINDTVKRYLSTPNRAR